MNEPASPALRAGRWAWIVALVVFSAVMSERAPTGDWTHRIFGTPAWSESDPGAYYVASAHELGWGEPPLFVGHPGATLTPLLWAVQTALYGLLADEAISFTGFTARHLPLVFLASKLLVTLVHVLSFLVLLRLAWAVLGDPRAAELAVLGYATSLPVLFHLSRISVEPLMVTFFAASLLAVFRWEERARGGRPGAALLAAGAGAASVAGALTKLNFLGPLPFFCLLPIAVGSEAGPDRGARMRALAAFLAAGLVVFALLSQIVDWRDFWDTWATIGRTPPGGFAIADLLPGLDARHVLVTSELAFVLCAAAGAAGFLRRPGSGSRRRALWLLLYGGFAGLLFAYRVFLHGSFLPFHYAFLCLVVLCVFFGSFASRVAERAGAAGRGWRGGALLVAALLALHGVAAATVVGSRLADAKAWARLEPVYALLPKLEAGQRVGVERRMDRPLPFREHGFHFPMPLRSRPSRLQRELEALFVWVPPGSTRGLPSRRLAPRLRTHVAIVSESASR